MKLFVCDITELIAQQEDSVMWQQALSNLPAQRLEKVNRYKYHEDKARSIAAGFLLGYVLKTEYDLTAWELAYGEQGKPYLKDEEGIHFNLSHSKDYVVVCVDNHPCGVDIQKKKTLRPGFAERFFHPRELEFGLQTSGFACTDKSSDAVQEDVSPADKSSDAVQEDVSPADKSSDAVQEDVSPADKSSDAVQENAASAEKISVDIQMQIWSMKEALMKYSGKGMSRNLLSFSVVPLLTGEIMEEEGRKVVGAGLSLLPDYSLCAVWEGTHFNHPEIKIFSWNELFEEVVTKNKEKP